MARKVKRSEQLADGGSYELLVHLASGGMGSVFVGYSKVVGADERLRAIKRAHPHLLDDPTFRKMFVAEAKLAMRLHTPHVVGVTDVDESDGELLLVMDYVEGGSFAEVSSATRKADASIPKAVVLRLVTDAALGLHEAHALRSSDGRPLGLVHRDVSPQNILCGIDGTARIVDFGVAKALDHEGSHTASGVFKGKVAYMAPEYLRDRMVSPAIDIFALGVVAWEAIAQKRLFRRNSELETIQTILSDDECPHLSDVVDVDENVARVIGRALEKDPARRWSTAADFAAALAESATAARSLATRAEVATFIGAALSESLAETRVLLRTAARRAATGTQKLLTAGLLAAPSTDDRTTVPHAEPVREGAASTEGERTAPIERSESVPMNEPSATTRPRLQSASVLNEAASAPHTESIAQEEPTGPRPVAVSGIAELSATAEPRTRARALVVAFAVALIGGGLLGAVLIQGAGGGSAPSGGRAPSSSTAATSTSTPAIVTGVATPEEPARVTAVAPTSEPSVEQPAPAQAASSVEPIASATAAPAPRPVPSAKWVPKSNPYARP